MTVSKNREIDSTIFDPDFWTFGTDKCCVMLIQAIYMVQYAIIQHFYQKSGKSWNFHLPVIFKVMHAMSSYVSQNDHRTIKVHASISPVPIDLYKKPYEGSKMSKIYKILKNAICKFWTFWILHMVFYTNLWGPGLY